MMPSRFIVGSVAAAVAIAVTGCSKPGPAISDVGIELNPNSSAPLVAICTFSTDEPALSWAQIDDGDRSFTTPPSAEFVTNHRIVILGLQPDHENTITISVTSEDGRTSTAGPIRHQTLPLPQDFPPVDVVLARPEKMEPGFTLVPFTRWPKGAGPDRSFGVLYALDGHGRIVWYLQTDHHLSDVQRTANGNLLYHYGRFGHAREVDMLGNVVRAWHATGSAVEHPESSIPVKTTTFHHDLQELPNGNFMALSLEVRHFDQYPASETDPDASWEPAYVIGDVIVEFEPDGTVLNMWSLMDILDPYRIGYDSLDTGFWQDVFAAKLPEPARDWSHANSIDYLPDERAVLVSVYHQDALFKFDLETEELEWIISFPTGWREPWQEKLLTPVGEGLYPAHQHSGKRTPHGTVILFDNGTFRARPFDPKVSADDSFSRAVEYAIDEKNMTFREVWSYGGPGDEKFFSPILGEVDWLPETQNILITDGGRVRREDGGPGIHPNQGKEWARIVEVTHTEPAKKVFEVQFEDDKWGWTVYRSERVPSLYPQ